MDYWMHAIELLPFMLLYRIVRLVYNNLSIQPNLNRNLGFFAKNLPKPTVSEI